ncbi:MAG: hypothetical protein EZS28_052220, partial [Streblomastix strix]
MNHEEQQNEGFICPITQEIIIDPVITEDGISYERQVIVNWLKVKKMSPITRQPTNGRQLPNIELKKQIYSTKLQTSPEYISRPTSSYSDPNSIQLSNSHIIPQHVLKIYSSITQTQAVQYQQNQKQVMELHLFVDNMEEDYYVTKISNAVRFGV